jgi:predicted transcriptional regulator
MPDNTVRFPVRLPSDLHQTLKLLASKNHRSLHSEVLVALEQYVDQHREILDALDDNAPR